MKHYEKDVAAPRSTSKAGCAEDSDDSEAGREAVNNVCNKTAYQHGFEKFKRDRASSRNMIKYEDQKADDTTAPSLYHCCFNINTRRHKAWVVSYRMPVSKHNVLRISINADFHRARGGSILLDPSLVFLGPW